MSTQGLTVTEVLPDSTAAEIGICRGDRIASINGKELRDPIDYRYLISEERLLLEIIKPNGEVWEAEVEKEPDDELGIDFDPMKIRQCPNKCFFCFVDQNPQGARDPLYIRDEDYRFSFLYGNYITLTNLTKKDKARIFEQRLSPLYVSVHTTDPALRRIMLGNPRARDIIGEIAEMRDHGILLHTQVVLCPGVNDGAYLTQSIEDLLKFFPGPPEGRGGRGGVGSLAVIPVGITRHREGLWKIPDIDVACAREALSIIAGWQKRFTAEVGYPFVFAADEWFVKGARPFPALSEYYDLPQLENGVGMVRKFFDEFGDGLKKLPAALRGRRKIVLATGASFARYLREIAAAVKIEGLAVSVAEVPNLYFGNSVTAAGLLAGRDFAKVLAGVLADLVVLPKVALNEEGLFIDSMAPADLEKAIGRPLRIIDHDAGGLIEFLKSL